MELLCLGECESISYLIWMNWMCHEAPMQQQHLLLGMYICLYKIHKWCCELGVLPRLYRNFWWILLLFAFEFVMSFTGMQLYVNYIGKYGNVMIESTRGRSSPTYTVRCHSHRQTLAWSNLGDSTVIRANVRAKLNCVFICIFVIQRLFCFEVWLILPLRRRRTPVGLSTPVALASRLGGSRLQVRTSELRRSKHQRMGY